MDKLKVMIKISRTIIYLPFPLIAEVEIQRWYRNLKLYTRISGRSFKSHALGLGKSLSANSFLRVTTA
jgi:hypothetical protein